MFLLRRFSHKAYDSLSCSTTWNTHKSITFVSCVLLYRSVGLVRNQYQFYSIFHVGLFLLSLVFLVHPLEDKLQILVILKSINITVHKRYIYLYFFAQNTIKIAFFSCEIKAVIAKWVNFLFQNHPT